MTFRKGRGPIAPAVRKIMSRKSRKKTTTANSLADCSNIGGNNKKNMQNKAEVGNFFIA